MPVLPNFNEIAANFKFNIHSLSKNNMSRSLFLLIAMLLTGTALFAQNNVIRLQECSNTEITKQVDSLKEIFTKNGYKVMKEASIAMESEYEMPVVVPMQQGGLYQFVFIGDMSSKLYEVRMYDWNEKMVVYKKKMWGDVDGNIISYPYSPQFTEYHMIKPVQVNKKKKKDLCGYVMLLKRVQ